MVTAEISQPGDGIAAEKGFHWFFLGGILLGLLVLAAFIILVILRKKGNKV